MTKSTETPDRKAERERDKEAAEKEKANRRRAG
jgi:hypothetical protein